MSSNGGGWEQMFAKLHEVQENLLSDEHEKREDERKRQFAKELRAAQTREFRRREARKLNLQPRGNRQRDNLSELNTDRDRAGLPPVTDSELAYTRTVQRELLGEAPREYAWDNVNDKDSGAEKDRATVEILRRLRESSS